MSLLCHKIIKAIADEGVAEARMLLQDWLVILTAKYNQHMMRRTGMPMDTSFSKFDNLKMVPKFVYGMLRGKMMDVLVSLAGLGSGFACGIRVGGDEGCACMQRENEKERGEERSYTDIMAIDLAKCALPSNLWSFPQRASRDERAFVSHICSSMNSEAVGLMLYPRLMSFPDLDSERPVDDLFVLSHAAIDQNSQQLYLLDSLTELLVYYPRAAKGSVPFPPPVDSGIRYASLIRYSRHTARHNPALFPVSPPVRRLVPPRRFASLLYQACFLDVGDNVHVATKRHFIRLNEIDAGGTSRKSRTTGLCARTSSTVQREMHRDSTFRLGCGRTGTLMPPRAENGQWLLTRGMTHSWRPSRTRSRATWSRRDDVITPSRLRTLSCFSRPIRFWRVSTDSAFAYVWGFMDAVFINTWADPCSITFIRSGQTRLY